MLCIRTHTVYLLDEAHGDEFVSYHVPGLVQSCQIFVEAWIFRFDILLDDFHFQVLLTLCTIVGTGAFLLLRRLACNCVLRCRCRGLSLRFVPCYLGESLDYALLLGLFLRLVFKVIS